ncbi:MAG: ATP-binding protein [Streptosporangiaceae bacterium]
MSALRAPPIAWSRAFPADALQAREARRFLAALLDGHRAADDALLCLSEVVTNAMVHSRSHEPGGSFTVRAQLHGGCLRVEVTDQGGPWKPPAPAGADGQNGRGLLIVDQLAARWGRTGDQHAGWTLWYEMHAPARHPNDATPSPPAGRPRSAAQYLTIADGQRLRELRRQHGLSQRRLADLAQVSPATVARLERRPHSSCRGRTLGRLAAALGEEPVSIIAKTAARNVLDFTP